MNAHRQPIKQASNPNYAAAIRGMGVESAIRGARIEGISEPTHGFISKENARNLGITFPSPVTRITPEGMVEWNTNGFNELASPGTEDLDVERTVGYIHTDVFPDGIEKSDAAKDLTKRIDTEIKND